MILDIQDLSFRYRSRKKLTLCHLDFSIEDGEMVLLAGRSGSGKSTLIKAVTRLLDEKEGELSGHLFLDGKDVKTLSAEDVGLLAGTVYQTPDDQLFAMTVGDEVAFALENRGEERDIIQGKVARALEKTGLAGMEGRSIHALSGGQRQRLALASVLVTEPRLLILDEPVSQMNPQGVASFLALLKELNREGMTILVIEHRVNEMARWFPRIAVLYEGRFVYDGPMEGVWSAIGDVERYGLREPQSVRLGRRLRLPVLSSSVEKTAGEIKTIGIPLISHIPPEKEKKETTPDFLTVKDVHYRYAGASEETLHGISFSLKKGSINALMGTNGAGKSTLMNILGGLERETSGTVLLEGAPLFREEHRVGYLRQEADLMLLTDTVMEEMMWNNDTITEEEADALLRRLHVRHYKHDFPLALSKGQRLRVALGAMLARKDNELLLLDEPTTGQDQKNLTEIKGLLQYAASMGRTVLFITHDTEMASDIADQVLVLSGGVLIGKGRPEEMFKDRNLMKQGGLSAPPMLDLSRMLSIDPCISIKEVISHVASPALGGRER